MCISQNSNTFKHTLSGSEERVLMRMLIEKDTQKVVGMHMVGPDAGELIQGFAVAGQSRTHQRSV